MEQNNKKKIIIIIVVALSILIVIGVVFYFIFIKTKEYNYDTREYNIDMLFSEYQINDIKLNHNNGYTISGLTNSEIENKINNKLSIIPDNYECNITFNISNILSLYCFTNNDKQKYTFNINLNNGTDIKIKDIMNYDLYKYFIDENDYSFMQKITNNMSYILNKVNFYINNNAITILTEDNHSIEMVFDLAEYQLIYNKYANNNIPNNQNKTIYIFSDYINSLYTKSNDDDNFKYTLYKTNNFNNKLIIKNTIINNTNNERAITSSTTNNEIDYIDLEKLNSQINDYIKNNNSLSEQEYLYIYNFVFINKIQDYKGIIKISSNTFKNNSLENHIGTIFYLFCPEENNCTNDGKTELLFIDNNDNLVTPDNNPNNKFTNFNSKINTYLKNNIFTQENETTINDIINKSTYALDDQNQQLIMLINCDSNIKYNNIYYNDKYIYIPYSYFEEVNIDNALQSENT